MTSDAINRSDAMLDDTPEDTATIRSQIVRTREDMSETIDEIQARLSPRNLVSRARPSVKAAIMGPALLVGASAAWWFIDRSRRHARGRTTVIDYEHDDGTIGHYEVEPNAASKIQRLIRRSPLALGAVAATLGIAAGLAGQRINR